MILAIGALFVTIFACYGWLRFCEDYVDPFIKRVVARLTGRVPSDGGGDG